MFYNPLLYNPLLYNPLQPLTTPYSNLTYNFAQQIARFAGVSSGAYQVGEQPNDLSTNQLRWDTWGGVPGIQTLFGSTLVVNAAGNHEIEGGYTGGPNNRVMTPATSGLSYASGQYAFQSWSARFPNANQLAAYNPATNASSAGTFGDITSNIYWSQNIGPVHVLVLQAYYPYAPGTPQYAFAVNDLKNVNRAVTPWLFVMHHAPLYTTYEKHYKDAECFKSIYETLYLNYGVDFVLSGHVHAYERSHPLYQYKINQCGPVYLSVGDGGNIEGPYRNYVDDIDPATKGPWCVSSSTDNKLKRRAVYGNLTSGGYNPLKAAPGYARAVQNAAVCAGNRDGYGNATTLSYQTQPAGQGVGPDPSGSGKWFCSKSQPAYSAYRDPSFGTALLTITSATSATFNWRALPDCSRSDARPRPIRFWF